MSTIQSNHHVHFSHTWKWMAAIFSLENMSKEFNEKILQLPWKVSFCSTQARTESLEREREIEWKKEKERETH